MGKYFGTDGFRGEANVSLTNEHAVKIGRFLGWYYGAKQNKKAKIVIGKDTRRSSYMFENALASGIIASGGDVYFMRVTTTPSVAYIARTEDFDCGIMISASHNPFYDNGIKLINGNGEKMSEAVIAEVEAYIDADPESIPYAKKEAIGCAFDHTDARQKYADYLISLAPASLEGMKIGMDCSNGSASALAHAIFEKLGADVHLINATPDGVNINTNCGSTHLEVLQQYVIDNKLDAGFAYDGDADRCLCVDENGEAITGDHILYIYGAYLKKLGQLKNNTVVTTVMSNFGLYKAFDVLNIDYAKTAVGDKYVYEYMAANDCVIGGEQSGHIIFSEYASTGDGILTSIEMAKVMLEEKKSLKELTADLQIFPQTLKNIRVTDKKGAQNDADVQAAVQAVADKLGDSGRILVRESGTEPLVRVMVEAPSKELCENYVDEVINVIKEKGWEE